VTDVMSNRWAQRNASGPPSDGRPGPVTPAVFKTSANSTTILESTETKSAAFGSSIWWSSAGEDHIAMSPEAGTQIQNPLAEGLSE
jgi:hypothetical protein